MYNRYLMSVIESDLHSKIVLVTGPRQAGKTTLARAVESGAEYLNYDTLSHRQKIINQSWDSTAPMVIFDELHKMQNWKLYLKGIFDDRGIPPKYLVTGSAKLDAFRKVGDSLAGRFFRHRLHPFDIQELRGHTDQSPDLILTQLMRLGNFPEPYLSGKESFYRRWQSTHSDVIIRQDLLDLTTISDIPKLELLIELLAQRVGGCVSNSNLARDLEKDPNTIKRWLNLLENLYIIFKVPPYSRNIARTVRKEPKYYFYDLRRVPNHAARLENLVACALLKRLHYIEDTEGYKTGLYFLRTRDGKELDFLTHINDRPTRMIEVKQSDHGVSNSFQHFRKFLPHSAQTQLVQSLDRRFDTREGISVDPAAAWLARIGVFF